MCPPSNITPSTPPAPPPNPTSPPTLHQIGLAPAPIPQGALDLATTHLPPAILNHSIRVYRYASALAHASSSIYARDPAKTALLFTACILHDIGVAPAYDGSQRFEVEGADAAVAFLSSSSSSSSFPDVPAEDRKEVWMAIACHTSPHIAERIGELSRLVRVAVLIDFGREDGLDGLGGLRAELEGTWERNGIRKVLGDAVVRQAVESPERDKAPMASWPGVMYRAHLAEPEWEGVNKAFSG